MRGGQRDTEEVFAPYASYLDSVIWPSIKDGRKDLEHVDVLEMPPQRASACLGKLIRWARFEPTGHLATIDDVDLRQEEVMRSVLGESLAARALSLGEPTTCTRCSARWARAPASTRTSLRPSSSVAMGERFPEWAPAGAASSSPWRWPLRSTSAS